MERASHFPAVSLESLTRVGLGSAVVICFVCLMFQIAWWGVSRFPVTEVKVRGNLTYVSRQDIQDVLLNFNGTNFFQAPITEVETGLKSMPWISEVAIKRVWPDQIHIRLSELPPVAIWEDGHLISGQGDLVARRAQGFSMHEPALPKLYGQIQQLAWILESYLKIERLLGSGQFAIVSMELTEYQHWRLILRDILADSVVEVWVDDDNAQAKLREFLEIWAELKGFNGSVPVRLDLRYPRAIAVKWAETANVK